MSRLWLLIPLLLLGACTADPDPRPVPLQQAAKLIAEGNEAYRRDEYTHALDNYAGALAQYRSIDDRSGIELARINLVQSALRLGQFELAQQQLSLLQGGSDARWQGRVLLLKASLDYRQQRYEQAITALSTLLPKSSGEQIEGDVDDLGLQALASRASIAVDQRSEDAAIWLARYASALEQQDEGGLGSARLHRLQAQQALNRGELQQALTLVERSLSGYRAAAARPGTAAALRLRSRILETLGELEAATAEQRRALSIAVWMRDRAHTELDLLRLAVLLEASDEGTEATRMQRWADDVADPHFSRWLALYTELGQ